MTRDHKAEVQSQELRWSGIYTAVPEDVVVIEIDQAHTGSLIMQTLVLRQTRNTMKDL